MSADSCDNAQQKLWSSGRVLGSQSGGRGLEPRPIMLDGIVGKAIPGKCFFSFQKTYKARCKKSKKCLAPTNIRNNDHLLYRIARTICYSKDICNIRLVNVRNVNKSTSWHSQGISIDTLGTKFMTNAFWL
jgi:hypothetical protein